MKKGLRIGRDILIGTLVFAGCAAAGFFLTPTEVKKIEQGYEPPIDDTEETHLQKFINKVTTNGMGSLDADVDLTLTWPSNNIKIGGDLMFKMESLDKIDLNLGLNVDYNNEKLDLNVSYVDKTMYLGLKDLRIKMPFLEADDFIDELAASLQNDAGFDLSELLNIDLGSLLSGDMSLEGISISEQEVNNNVRFCIKTEEGVIDGLQLDLYLESDKEYNLKGIFINTIKYNNLSVFGKITCETVTGLNIPSPEIPGEKEYEVVFSYLPMIKKILRTIGSKKVGLDLGVTLDYQNTEIGSILGKIFVDISQVESLNDFKKINFDLGLDLIGNEASKNLNGVKEKYSSILLNYINGDGYLKLNENVLKALLDAESINILIGKIIDTISASGNEPTVDTEKLEGLFDFVTGSDLVMAIQAGHYEGILTMIKELSSKDNKITLVVSLESLGLGSNSEVKIILDSNENEAGTNVLSIEINKVVLSSFSFDLYLKTLPYDSSISEAVLLDRANYDSFAFANDIYGQIEQYIQTNQAGLAISGSVLDDLSDGFSFAGSTQFDVNEKIGYGDINFNEYKNGGNLYDTHNLKIDVTGDEEGAMLFAYQEKLKGKFTINTLNDLIGLVVELLGTDDVRFTKFLDPIKEMILASTIGKILETKDYFKLTKNDVITQLRMINNGKTLAIGINGDLVGLDTIIRINVNLGESNSLDSLDIVDLSLLGKTINFHGELTTYDTRESKQHILSENDGNYLDFSDIVVLLRFAIKTSQLNYYHLTASASIGLGSFLNLSIELDFYIQVQERSVKVIGYIDNIPTVIGVNKTNILAIDGKRSCVFAYEPNENPSEKGYIHVRRETNYAGSAFDEHLYWVSTSNYFLDNIVDYLLRDMVGLTDGMMDLVEKEDDKEKTPIDFEEMFGDEGGFEFIESTTTWNIGINLGVLAQTNLLKYLFVTIKGDSDGYLSTIHAETTLSIGLKIGIKADFALVDINPNAEGWPTNIDNKFNSLVAAHNKTNLNKGSGTSDNLSFTRVF